MRSLLDEYGHLIISVIVASIMIVGGIFGIVIPQMKNYTQMSTPASVSEFTDDFNATALVIARPSPVVVTPEFLIDQYTLLNFDNCIFGEKSITATNAEGVDISHRIKITPANEETAMFYDSTKKQFGGVDLVGGEYKFILTVEDVDENSRYGKITKAPLIITVEEDE